MVALGHTSGSALLMLSRLGKTFDRRPFDLFLHFVPSFVISCKFSHQETICLKCQIRNISPICPERSKEQVKAKCCGTNITHDT